VNRFLGERRIARNAVSSETDQALHLALELMSKYRLDVLQVVHRADIHKLEDFVTLPDILDALGIDRIGSK
jgi:DNA integrity scanning protein DisA with diadenylate cyclase activity